MLGHTAAYFWSMTAREFNLARQGYELQVEDRRRQEAGWMAMILNTQYANAEISTAQLMGEEEEQVDESRMKAERRQAEKRLEKMLAKRGTA